MWHIFIKINTATCHPTIAGIRKYFTNLQSYQGDNDFILSIEACDANRRMMQFMLQSYLQGNVNLHIFVWQTQGFDIKVEPDSSFCWIHLGQHHYINKAYCKEATQFIVVH